MLIAACLNGDCNQDERRRSFSVESPFFLSYFNASLKRMETVMKGIYKGFKYTISQIFVVKEEQELQIGGPTDVKHVSHIGWDGSSEAAPSWMNEFKTGNDFATSSIATSGSSLSPWSSRDSDESVRQQSESEMFKDTASTDVPSAKKKERRRKPKSTSSPRSNSSLPSRPSRPGKPKQKDSAEATNIEVA